jgi:phytol kinase
VERKRDKRRPQGQLRAVWLDPFFRNKLAQDVVATGLTFLLSLVWLRLMDGLAQRGVITPQLSRKIIHIGTGPLFLLCWHLYSSQAWARGFAALVPLAITAQFVVVGLGWLQDPAAVEAMTRHGDRREILRGPLYYGLVFVVATLIFWRGSPAGVVALMLLCGGDGLADIVGRRWGRAKLPINPAKSWAGSLAMFAGGWGFALVFLWIFNALGDFSPGLALWPTVLATAFIALVATVVEALPLGELDNLTIAAVGAVLGLLLL